MSQSTNLSHHSRRIDLDAPLHRKAGPTAHAMRPVEGAGEPHTPQTCPPPRYLTNSEAAAFLRLSPRTLEKQR
ncbi:MAG: DNA-binding protein, partial [Pseudomonadales bacterium]